MLYMMDRNPDWYAFLNIVNTLRGKRREDRRRIVSVCVDSTECKPRQQNKLTTAVADQQGC
jgi:hypothetical protein